MASGQTDPQIPPGTFFELLVLSQRLVSPIGLLSQVIWLIHPFPCKLT